MDARQQTTVAPLELARTGKPATQHDALGFKADERARDVRLGDRERGRERGSRCRTHQ